MAYVQGSGVPIGENAQDNAHNAYDWADGRPWWPGGGLWYPDRGHRRAAAGEPPYVEYDRYHRGWYQGPDRMPSSFKPKLYWARPSDGKRKGALGRLKDVLTGEGADVYVVANGDRRTLHRDMPHRPQWSGWNGWLWDPNWGQYYFDKDFSDGEHAHGSAPWASRSGEKYNFYTRKYEDGKDRRKHDSEGMLWTDAHWPDGTKDSDMNPWSFRTKPFTHSVRVPWYAGYYPGGRPQWPR